MNKKKVGMYLEYYRLKNNISLKDFLMTNNYEICSRPTYRKVREGTCEINTIYEELITLHNIVINEHDTNRQLYTQYLNNIKHHLEFRKDNELELLLQNIVTNQNPTSFPNQCLFDFFCTMYHFITKNRKITPQEFFYHKLVLPLFSDAYQIAYYALYYRNTYQFTHDASLLKKSLGIIPKKFHNFSLFQFWRVNQLQFENRTFESIKVGETLEIELIKNNNLLLLFFLYQTLHGNYNSIENTQKVNYYFELLKKASKDQTLDETTKNNINYYIAMCYFSSHNFVDAKTYMKQLLDTDLLGNKFLILPYFHILSFFKASILDNDKLSIMKTASSTHKVFSEYYKMKGNSVNLLKLKRFLCEKLLYIINENNILEYHIILEELLILGFYEEFRNLLHLYKQKNLSLIKPWISFFEKQQFVM